MKVIELALFKLRANVTEAQFLVAFDHSNVWLSSLPGFIQRRHGVDNDGRVDIVEWESMAAAKAAAQQFMEAPETQAFMSAIDPESVIMRHFELMS